MSEAFARGAKKTRAEDKAFNLGLRQCIFYFGSLVTYSFILLFSLFSSSSPTVLVASANQVQYILWFLDSTSIFLYFEPSP